MNNFDKAIFLGSKPFGLELLIHLISLSPNMRWQVICPIDSDDSRSCEDAFREFASENPNISSIHFPENKNELYEVLEKDNVILGVVCGWYSILSDEILQIPKNGFWGIHHSLLPKYRGFSPLVWSILNGDEFVGSTIFRITSEMDAGDYVSQVQVRNRSNKSIGEIMREIEIEIIEKFSQHWRELENGNPSLTVQNEIDASYVRKRTEEDAEIKWTQAASDIHNLIRALAKPYPGAYFRMKDDVYKVFKSEVEDLTSKIEPGRIISLNHSAILVSCGQETALRIFLDDIEVENSMLKDKLKIGVQLSREQEIS